MQGETYFHFGDPVNLVGEDGTVIASGIVCGTFGGTSVRWKHTRKFKGFTASNPAPAGCKLVHAEPAMSGAK